MHEPETKKPGKREEGLVRSGEELEAARVSHGTETDGTLDHEAGGDGNPTFDALEEGGGPQELPPDVTGDAGLGEFAESVVSGFEQAGLSLDELARSEGSEAGPGAGHTGERYFSDWGSVHPEHAASSAKVHQASSLSSGEAPAPSLRALAGQSSAASIGNSRQSSPWIGKHDELADAVQAALFTIYGRPGGQQGGGEFPAESGGESVSPAMTWDSGLRETASSDGLSPQDVIANYFDYTPGESAGLAGGGPAGAQLRRGHNQTRAVQYDGPPSFPFPVPAGPPASSKSPGRVRQESGRLLGAAAIGMVGGIAIAASLAAFLIYGPRPAAIELPGMGKLRLDKDEQGYGQRAAEELGLDSQKIASVKAAPEFSSEVLTADVTASPGQPAPISISVRSNQPFEKTLVSIAGLPEGGRLSAGVDTGGGNWLLPPRRLSGLTINLPASAPEIVSLQAQLLDSNARTPLSAKSDFTVRLKAGSAAMPAPLPQSQTANQVPARPAQAPASVLTFNTQTIAPQASTSPAAPVVRVTPAPPAAGPDANFKTQTLGAGAPASPPVPPFQTSPVTAPQTQEAAARRVNPRPEIEDLIREGNKRMREGDILEARQIYQKAVVMGDAEAALAMGRSYDPIYFARIDRKNAEPDPAKAFDWYRKAMDAGAAQTAMVRIENLKHFLNE
jgi:hypothetical protein